MPDPHIIDANTTLLCSKASLPIESDWFSADYWQKKNALIGTGHGRGEVWFINSEFGNFVMRRYRRGGLIAKFNKDAFLFTKPSDTRPWQELSLLETMVELGLPVPQPIAGIYRKKWGFYRAHLLTQTIEDATDLFDILKAGNSDSVDWKNIGHVIQEFHRHGIHHSDLNCHNIMIDKQQKVWIIDFDKCEQREIHDEWTQGNINRLKRSLDKESQIHTNFNVSDAQWRDLLEGYRG
ncbi:MULTISPECIES: 3-deoxy-D-manno-octulosonic acid kinase [Marinomonas]|jgi:3-deoxy-D-manno-octulosonic acid kinase|uniref:3-deoxy-D-manno-octulosonic acid kinase n=1 Tax=Marinomonas TaxID=28253 RepID=UPI00105481AB|nr:3-deoxy-D-manno-octulosonic acid kinase [Marinomonas sp. KMM3893]